ncbi:MAG: hypothetical protein PHG00_12275 [Methylococcales bacterium]|nr:hypothetical protein [Methylococcales bacterium]
MIKPILPLKKSLKPCPFRGAGENDLALTQGAASGDILFAEACAKLGMRIQLLQPFSEPEFILRSILPSDQGEKWRVRYFKLKERLLLSPRFMPNELGPLPKGVDPYERCNLWLLYTALTCGVDKVRFICLWDGGRRWGRRHPPPYVPGSEGTHRTSDVARYRKIIVKFDFRILVKSSLPHGEGLG